MGKRWCRCCSRCRLASVASAIIMVLGLNGGTVNTQTAISTSIAVAIPLSVAGLFLTMICRTIAIPLVHLMDGLC